MSGIELIPVRSSAQLRAFIDLPWTLYRDYPLWVPPLRRDFARLLDPARHPFWQSAERELFLVRRGGTWLGRIAAIIDRAYNSFHGEAMGVWGFFECAHDPDAAAALFGATAEWAAGRGAVFLRGPLNPSTNYTAGLLIQGFDLPPALMMPYNPPYYLELVRHCGFRKEKDLLAYRLSRDFQPPAWALSFTERTAARAGVRLRLPDPRRLRDELRLMTRVYNRCWAGNWGFSPMSDAEVDDSARRLIRVFDPDLGFFLCRGDEPVGVGLLLPDLNPLLKRFDGRLGLAALVKSYLYRSEVQGLRFVLFGLAAPLRQIGVSFVALSYLLGLVERKRQFRYVELSWVLEDNEDVNAFFQQLELPPYKVYRLYRRDL